MGHEAELVRLVDELLALRDQAASLREREGYLKAEIAQHVRMFALLREPASPAVVAPTMAPLTRRGRQYGQGKIIRQHFADGRTADSDEIRRVLHAAGFAHVTTTNVHSVMTHMVRRGQARRIRAGVWQFPHRNGQPAGNASA